MDELPNPEEQALETVALGADAEAFKRTALGRFLNDRALLEVEKCKQALVDAAPDDLEANTKLRNDIRVAYMFLDWLDEAISAGAVAERQLKEMDAYE